MHAEQKYVNIYNTLLEIIKSWYLWLRRKLILYKKMLVVYLFMYFTYYFIKKENKILENIPKEKPPIFLKEVRIP